MTSDDFQAFAFSAIKTYCDGADDDNIVLVWFSKTLQHYKGLFFCFANKHYYEATYDGDYDYLYLDEYVKYSHRTLMQVDNKES